MRNLLALMMTLILVVGAVGWYLDWFKVKASPGTDGHTAVNIDWNSLKFHQDVSKVATKGAELLDKKAKDVEAKVEADKKAKAEAEKTAGKDPTKAVPSGE